MLSTPRDVPGPQKPNAAKVYGTGNNTLRMLPASSLFPPRAEDLQAIEKKCKEMEEETKTVFSTFLPNNCNHRAKYLYALIPRMVAVDPRHNQMLESRIPPCDLIEHALAFYLTSINKQKGYKPSVEELDQHIDMYGDRFTADLATAIKAWKCEKIVKDINTWSQEAMFEMRHRVRQRRVQSGNIPPATALQQLDEVLSSLEQVRDTPNDNNQTPSPAHDPVNNSGMNRPRTAQVKNQHRQRHDQQEPHAGGPQLHQSASSRNSDNSPLKRKTAGDSAARIPTEAKRRKRAPPTRSRSHEVFFQCPHVHSNSDDLDAKCYTRFKEMYKLRKHITTSHWQHVLFKCLAPDCNKDFVTLNNLVRHVLCPKQRLTCLQSIVQRGQSISEINSKYGADLNRLQECIEQRDWNTLETRPKMKDPFGRVVQEIHTIFSQSTPEQQQCLQDLKELKFRTNMKSEAKQQLWENLFHIMGRFATSSLDRVDPIPKWNDYVEPPEGSTAGNMGKQSWWDEEQADDSELESEEDNEEDMEIYSGQSENAEVPSSTRVHAEPRPARFSPQIPTPTAGSSRSRINTWTPTERPSGSFPLGNIYYNPSAESAMAAYWKPTEVWRGRGRGRGAP